MIEFTSDDAYEMGYMSAVDDPFKIYYPAFAYPELEDAHLEGYTDGLSNFTLLIPMKG